MLNKLAWRALITFCCLYANLAATITTAPDADCVKCQHENSLFAKSVENSSYAATCTTTDSNGQCSEKLMMPRILNERIHHHLSCQNSNNTGVCSTEHEAANLLHEQLGQSMYIPVVKQPSWYNWPHSSMSVLEEHASHVIKHKGSKHSEWDPELAIFFRIWPTSIPLQSSFSNLMVPVLEKSRTFISTLNKPAISVTGLDKNRNIDEIIGGSVSGFIFPKELLANSKTHVDIIFPSLELVQDSFRNKFLSENPGKSKESFEEYFGWKKETPIKFAIIISQRIPTDSRKDNKEAYKRAKKVLSWLKSLPEGKNMPVVVALDSKQPVDSDKPLSVILFGGDGIHVESLFRSRYGHTNSLLADITKWKEDAVNKMPQIRQMIGFFAAATDVENGIHFDQLMDHRVAMLSGRDEVFGLEKWENKVPKIRGIVRDSHLCFVMVGFE